MSTADDVQTWFDAVQLYDAGDINGALDKLYNVTQNSRILFDIGCCYLSLNEIEKAERTYQAAVAQDSHMAIGYFMIGLTNYLLKQYDESMSYFEKSLRLLRDKRCVDYQQLGLKFQLYSCEILTNQAVVASLQNKFGKAKGLLLQAVGSKVEKKHGRITDAISLLQAGLPILPFTPPPSEIFRPPKAAVMNLKKKDYLGKAKVISTENTEEIYACFSGIKDQQSQPKPGKPKPRQVDRQKMLKELQLPDRQGTLKKTKRPPRKMLPTLTLGRVIESRPNKGLPAMPYDPSVSSQTLPAPNRRSRPDFNNNAQNDTYPRKLLPSAPSDITAPTMPPPRRPIPSIPQERKEYQPAVPTRNEEYDALSYYEDENYEDVDSVSILRSVESEKRQSSHEPPQKNPPRRSSSESIDGRSSGQRRQSNATKPGRAPPPPPAQSEEIIAPPRRCFPRQISENASIPPKRSETNEANHRKRSASNAVAHELKNTFNTLNIGKLPSQQSTNNNSIDTVSQEQMKVKEKTLLSSDQPTFEVEVQYTFVKKVQLQEGLTLQQVYDIVKGQPLPEGLEICFNDDLGRQQTLSEKKLPGALNSKKKLYCFPDS